MAMVMTTVAFCRQRLTQASRYPITWLNRLN
jgi:hypothetical protein